MLWVGKGKGSLWYGTSSMISLKNLFTSSWGACSWDALCGVCVCVSECVCMCMCVRGAGAGPAGTAAAGPMLEAKLMNLIKGWLQKF